MTERERTAIRLIGLVVHGVGLVTILFGIGTGESARLIIGVIAFVVGGAWGWGMVVFAAREAAERERRAEQRRQHEVRNGFRSTFEDEPEPVILPPPGTTAGPGSSVPLKPWSP